MKMSVGFLFAAWAAYNFGPFVGYRYWDAHDPFQAAFYGGGSVFVAALFVGGMIVWPIVRNLSNMLFGSVSRAQLAARRKHHARPAIAEADLEEAVRRGYIFAYYGLVDRDYHYQVSGNWEKQRLRNDFSVSRNTATIPRREQQAVIIFETLEREGRLGGEAEKLRFALAWGDGRCQVSHGRYVNSVALLTQNNFRTFKDVIASEAARLNASMDDAINSLYTSLQLAADGNNPAAKRLAARYSAAAAAGSGGDPWS